MANDAVTTLTDSNFEAEVLQSDVPVLVDFWAEYCPPCKALSPLVTQLASQHAGKLKVGKLDVQHNMNMAMQYGVVNIPMLLVFKNGEVVGVQKGARGGFRGLQKLVEPHI